MNKREGFDRSLCATSNLVCVCIFWFVTKTYFTETSNRPIDDCKLACFLCKYLVKMAFMTFYTFSTLEYNELHSCITFWWCHEFIVILHSLCIHSTVKL